MAPPTWMDQNYFLWSVQKELILDYLRVYREDAYRENTNVSMAFRRQHEKEV